MAGLDDGGLRAAGCPNEVSAWRWRVASDIYPRFGYVKVLDQGVAELGRLRDVLSAVGSGPSPAGPAAESASLHHMA